MITLEYVYGFGGLIFAPIAVLSAMDRTNSKRLGNAAFWGLRGGQARTVTATGCSRQH
jgi:uncharacterized membrane protein